MSTTFSADGVQSYEHYTETCGCNDGEECPFCHGTGVFEGAREVNGAFNVSNVNRSRILRALGIEDDCSGSVEKPRVSHLMMAVLDGCQEIGEYRGRLAELFRVAIRNRTGVCWG